MEDIALMRKTVGPVMDVKASGGVRTYEDAFGVHAAGATRRHFQGKKIAEGWLAVR